MDQPKPVEDCDPAASPDGCAAPQACGPKCTCVATDPCGNGQQDAGEECDWSLSPTGCSDGQECTVVCTCSSCKPACADRECGSDGCGGACTPGCGSGDVCVDGKCLCPPSCQGKQCGSDGCGGSCPPGCSGQDACVEGACVCQPACQDRVCGADGCGGLCPPGCQGDMTCVQGGVCACTGDTFACGVHCCATDQKCVDFACCTPKDCAALDKQCGGPWDDGCGGTVTCPECLSDSRCTEGTCVKKTCGDGPCDADVGEDCESCPADCGCGDGETCVQGSISPGGKDACCPTPRACVHAMAVPDSIPTICCPEGQVCLPNDDCGAASPFASPVTVVPGVEWVQFGKVPGLYEYDVLQAAGTGSGGWGVYSAVTGATIYKDAHGANAYGIRLIRHPSGPWTVLGCGPGSCFYKTRSDTYGWNVMTVAVPFLGNVTDTVPLPEADPARVLYTSYSNNAVGLLCTVADSGVGPGWGNEKTLVPAGGLPEANGNVISAWGPSHADRQLAIVTAGGDLWWTADWDANVPMRVASGLGTDLRRFRCAGDHCGITDHGSRKLTIVRYGTAGGAPAVTSTLDVGDGAIGLDIIESGGSWWYLTTGSKDDTVAVTQVGSDFSVVTSAITPLTDCPGPGHASFNTDPAVRYFVVSCNGNGTAQILPY